VTRRVVVSPALPRIALLAAALLAGCAHRAPAPAPAPAPVSAAAPKPPAPPEDEVFRGVRFGASRIEVLRAYPGAACGPDRCTGDTHVHGLPAGFLVFAERDGRWIARLTVSDAASPGRNFRALGDELNARYPRLPQNIEQDGNLYRWTDRERQRQVVLHRCPANARCAGLPANTIEIAFQEQGAPLARPW